MVVYALAFHIVLLFKVSSSNAGDKLSLNESRMHRAIDALLFLIVFDYCKDDNGVLK